MRALSALSSMLARGIENPSTPITASSLAGLGELGGGHASGDPMRIGVALRCVQILAAGVAGCPLHVYNLEDHEKVDIPALSSLRAGPTPFERWETVVAHIAVRGNSFQRKVRTRDGRLVELVPINPTRVRVEVDDGAAAADVGLPWVKKFIVDGKVALSEYDILHIPGLSWNGVTGVSVIENLRRTFELATAAESVAADMFDHGMLQSGYLKVAEELDQEKADILKARWRAKVGGIDNAHDVMILDKGTTFEQLTFTPEDAQFLETRKFSITEIARIFGVPGWIVNDQEKSTSWGTGMEQQFISFVVTSLKPYFHRIEQRVTREILDPTKEKAEFKVEGLLRGDSKSRAAFYASGVTHGWLTPNDVRALEDMRPVTWGDEPYRPHTEPASPTTGTDQSGDDDDDDAA